MFKKLSKLSSYNILFVLILIMFLIILVSLWGDSCNWFTYVKNREIHTCNYRHINVWQQVSFIRTIMTMFSFIIAFIFGLINLYKIQENDYERTKAKLMIRFKKQNGHSYIELVNLGETRAKLLDVQWDYDLTLNDVTPKEQVIAKHNKNIFTEKINKYIYPREEIMYDIRKDYPIYEKLATQQEFNVEITWQDYKEKIHTFDYHFDFSNDLYFSDYNQPDNCINKGN